MESLRTFLHMGGYAVYVWSSYLLALVVLVVNVVMSRKGEQEFFETLKKRRAQPKKRPGSP